MSRNSEAGASGLSTWVTNSLRLRAGVKVKRKEDCKTCATVLKTSSLERLWICFVKGTVYSRKGMFPLPYELLV